MLALLTEVAGDIRQIRGERSEVEKQYYQLKERMNTLQGEVNRRTETLLVRMQRVSGNNTQIDDLESQLNDAFRKADNNGTGRLSVWQFSQAWSQLGLSGNEAEL